MATPDNVRGGYQEIETLDDPGGARAIITMRVGRGTYTASFCRMFDRDGTKERTAFFNVEHLESLERMIETAKRRLKELAGESKSANRR